ncbi:diacylglycerol/lipid kinase family protein [Roseomonas xinghualingensis]|uniref:diacylglycerol/lipid kinase family protein n=1 Tax=Roseomonas xinghualingensis TaxID=2986475 RepID=UPI0021F19CEF|nr:diacylglycerol kinase family protein [Roseomonas sp. SXEYE001]MCV4207619.1 diacylglycerol kinase family protein [Roseomonas sp. SXEYE001]
MTRAVLVMNNRAGTLAGRPELPAQIVAALREAGFDLTVIGEEVTPDISDRLEAALATDAPVVIVGGGDGTIRSAAARLARTDRVLGILPLGTLNLLARDLGIPLEPLAAAEALGRATPRAIDAGEVNGEIFLCQSVIGLPNMVGRARQRFRRRGGFYAVIRVVLAAIRALLHQRPMRLMVNAPGWERPWRLWTRAMSIVNNGYEEGTGLMFHRPRLDGGSLYLYVSRKFSVGWTAKMLIAMALGRWKRSSDIRILTGPAFSIHSRRRRLLVMNDGEGAVLSTPLQYAIHPRAITVLAPPPKDSSE